METDRAEFEMSIQRLRCICAGTNTWGVAGLRSFLLLEIVSILNMIFDKPDEL